MKERCNRDVTLIVDCFVVRLRFFLGTNTNTQEDHHNNILVHSHLTIKQFAEYLDV